MSQTTLRQSRKLNERNATQTVVSFGANLPVVVVVVDLNCATQVQVCDLMPINSVCSNENRLKKAKYYLCHTAHNLRRQPTTTTTTRNELKETESRRSLMRSKYQTNMILISAIILFNCALNLRFASSASTGPSGAQSTTTTTTTLRSSDMINDQMVFKHSDDERNQDFWLQSGKLALEQALKYSPNTRRAKNSIVFIGDGMSLPTITAARILYGQLLNHSGEEEQLSFERLNNVALIKTYNIDQQVPDSAATATAILCGVKTNFYTLGVNANVKLNDTNCQRIQQNHVHSIIKQAIDAGKSTGIVTNTRITHATPAAAYAHVSNRRWECDSYVPKNLDPACKDIARQLIEDEPGNKINVIMGGGRRCFFGANFIDPGVTGQSGIRHDNRNLIDQWLEHRRSENDRNFAFVNSTQDLRSVDIDKTDYLLGLFSFSHMNYEELRDQGPNGEPSLSEMTETAIKILSKNPLGYVLIVEGGRIDHAHHENVAGVALRETIALSWAVQTARNMIDQTDTLIAVTSDHAHALTINGLAPRGNPILGLSRFKENSSQVPYTTLIYGNGPGNQRPRADPTVGPNSTDSPYYVQYAAIHQEEAFHDGSDVAVFAAGPYAHLFQGVQEQSYIAHVFAYAMCIGDYTNQAHCHQTFRGNSNSLQRVDQAASDSANRPMVAIGAPLSEGDLNDGQQHSHWSSSSSSAHGHRNGGPTKSSAATSLKTSAQDLIGQTLRLVLVFAGSMLSVSELSKSIGLHYQTLTASSRLGPQ